MEARKVRASKVPPATREEDLYFLLQMLRELKPKAEEHDALLTNFIDMAYTQAADILSGKIEAEPPRKAIMFG